MQDNLQNQLLLAMTTSFMSNQTCRVDGSLWFLFDSYTLPEIITRHSSSESGKDWKQITEKIILSHFVVTEQRVFGIGAHSLFG